MANATKIAMGETSHSYPGDIVQVQSPKKANNFYVRDASHCRIKVSDGDYFLVLRTPSADEIIFGCACGDYKREHFRIMLGSDLKQVMSSVCGLVNIF